MTNTLKHLALLARMESSGLKLGLTGKFPEDALDQTCERVETDVYKRQGFIRHERRTP